MSAQQQTQADTQWPRYQVFVQEHSGAPHVDVGSVHAPDPELALQNARDVFARRPGCAGLWVVPAEVIFSRTAEQLAAEEELAAKGDRDSSIVPPSGRFIVFVKPKHSGSMTEVGSLEAPTPAAALERARRESNWQTGPSLVWWVLPEAAVTRAAPQDAPSLFEPGLDKPFRLSTDFHVVSAMRKVKR